MSWCFIGSDVGCIDISCNAGAPLACYGEERAGLKGKALSLSAGMFTNSLKKNPNQVSTL